MAQRIHLRIHLHILVLCILFFACTIATLTTQIHAQSLTLFTLSGTLKTGHNSPEVLILQRILNSDVDTQIAAQGPGSPGNETTYFGTMTTNAVQRFQQKYSLEVLIPAGLTAPTGVVGAFTRAQLEKVSGQGFIATATTAPSPTTNKNLTISHISEKSVAYNDTVTVTGTGFDKQSSATIAYDPYSALPITFVSENELSIQFKTPFIASIEAFLRTLSDDLKKDDFTTYKTAFIKDLGREINGKLSVPTTLIIKTGAGATVEIPLELIIELY